MARTINITSPCEKTDIILQELKEVDGLLELQVFRNVSLEPPGDVIKLSIPNSLLNEIMRKMDGHQLGRRNGISLSTTEPASIIPTSSSKSIESDNNEGAWEEMVMTISNDSNTSLFTLIIMFISGSLATVGIATNALHIVIGGMLVAPGFMPITRISIGFIGKNNTWYYGGRDLLKGYLMLIAGAIVTSLLLMAFGYEPVAGTSSYYVTEKGLVNYWTTITMASIMASIAASIAGAILVSTRKSVFTSGVMIGLALVPTAAIVGMGLISGNFELAWKAFLRFALDVAIVFTFTYAFFTWSHRIFHKRNIRM